MLTRKDIFVKKLKGEPIPVTIDETTDEEIELLVATGILKIDRESHGENVAIALYPIELFEMIIAPHKYHFEMEEPRPIYQVTRRDPGQFINY